MLKHPHRICFTQNRITDNGNSQYTQQKPRKNLSARCMVASAVSVYAILMASYMLLLVRWCAAIVICSIWCLSQGTHESVGDRDVSFFHQPAIETPWYRFWLGVSKMKWSRQKCVHVSCELFRNEKIESTRMCVFCACMFVPHLSLSHITWSSICLFSARPLVFAIFILQHRHTHTRTRASAVSKDWNFNVHRRRFCRISPFCSAVKQFSLFSIQIQPNFRHTVKIALCPWLWYV